MVGIELEDELPTQSVDDGAINGVRLFTCPPGRALFVQPEQCTIDRRFQDVKPPSQSLYETERRATESFGFVDCPIIEGAIPPPSMHLYSYIVYEFNEVNNLSMICFRIC